MSRLPAAKIKLRGQIELKNRQKYVAVPYFLEELELGIGAVTDEDAEDALA